MASRISEILNFTDKTKFVELNEPVKWSWRLAYLVAFGIDAAKNDIILFTDADYILDEKVEAALNLFGDGLGIVSFGRTEYPITFQNLMSQLLVKLHNLGIPIPIDLFSGSFAILKSAYNETVDIEDFKRVTRSLDTFVYNMIVTKYKSAFIDIRGLHLRPRESSKRHFIKGIHQYTIQHHSLWKVILHSFFYFRPLVLAGYLKAKLSQSPKNQ